MKESGYREAYQEKKAKRRRQIRRRVTALILVLLLACAGGWLYWRYAPTAKRMEPRVYFETMLGHALESEGAGEMGVSLGEGEAAVLLQDHVAAEKALVQGGALYLDYDLVRENICTRFFRDEERGLTILTTALDNLEIEDNADTYVSADDGSVYTYERAIMLAEGDRLYLDAAFLARQVNLDWTVFEDGAHVLVNYVWGERTAAAVKKSGAVRFGPGVKELVLTDAAPGDVVYPLEQGEKWSRVVTKDGFIGYLPNACLEDAQGGSFTHEFEAPVYDSLRMEEPVNLVWHQIGVAESNSYLAQDTADMTGVNVISPTWYALSDNEGHFDSLDSKAYVKKAHKMGLQVWGLVSNFSADMSTTALVASTAARRNLAQNLVDAALAVGMDGINVDLEAIAESAGYGYVQFVRELSVLCRKNDLVLSVDVPEPFDFNTYYDRGELGTVADYVILMGYDEHYAGSEAGSVASLAFEENGIRRTLEEVPAEKIIAGIPFYTRLWYSQEDGSVWSEILGMNAVTNTLETYGVTPVWDEQTQQNYAEWTLEDGILCRIWIEDEDSIALKAGLVKSYGLGGVAAWALGSERESIWDVISNAIR